MPLPPLELRHHELGIYASWFHRFMTHGVLAYRGMMRVRMCGRRFRSYRDCKSINDIEVQDFLRHPEFTFPVWGGLDDRGRPALLADDQEFEIPLTVKNVEFLLFTEVLDEDEMPAFLMQVYFKGIAHKLPLWWQGSLGGKAGRVVTFTEAHE